MFGDGKYDHLAALVRRKALSRFAAVIIGAGKKGNGFSLQFVSSTNPIEVSGHLRFLVKGLRSMADEIEKDALALELGHATSQTYAPDGPYTGDVPLEKEQ
jgi:hypothetical protein